ncbi:MAG: tetratricopeptide repeat protein [Balneolaceae bacterium]|nr:tetratricopeptide repeat protein [Balneolaceae bacterium]
MKKLSILLLAFLIGAGPDDARKANEAYNQGDYETAIGLYKKAIEANPENAKLYFNLGNALASTGQAEEAIRLFERYKTMTKDPARQSRADYNIGNVHAQQEQWESAAEAYRDALRYQDGDTDAKHNYELALQRQRQQQQQNQQGQNQQQQQQDQQQQNQDQNQQQNQQQQQNQDQQQQDQNQQQQNQQQQQMNQISKEEAEKILQALEQKERELLKEFKKQKTESSDDTNDKDW